MALTEEQMAENKKAIIDLLQTVKRPGMDKFIAWLSGPKSDFFVAPASTKYHGAYQGGLAEHSLDVYYRLCAEVGNEQTFSKSTPIGRATDYADYITMESVIITALAHDICKVNTYKWDVKNKKQPDGSWDQVPFITIDEDFPFGHGEKSVYILQSFIPLSREESIAIRYHMGDYRGDTGTSKAHEDYPLAALLHLADVKATYLTDRRNKDL